MTTNVRHVYSAIVIFVLIIYVLVVMINIVCRIFVCLLHVYWITAESLATLTLMG